MENAITKLVDQFELGVINRRQLVAGIGAMVAAWGLRSQEQDDKKQSTFEATELNHIALRVVDVKRSRDFYIKHLGMAVSRETENNCFLNFGNNFLALFHGETPKMDHYCYSVKDYDVNDAEAKLNEHRLNPRVVRGDGRIYFKDPDGLTVQLAAERHLP